MIKAGWTAISNLEPPIPDENSNDWSNFLQVSSIPFLRTDVFNVAHLSFWLALVAAFKFWPVREYDHSELMFEALCILQHSK